MGLTPLVETNAEGKSNWQFGDTDTDGLEDRGGAAPTQLPEITDIVLRNVQVTQRTIDPAADSVSEIRSAEIHIEDLRTPIKVSIDAAYQKVPIAASGELGPLVILTHSDAPYPVDITLTGEAVTGSVKGTIAEPLQARGLNLTVKLAVPEQSTIDALIGPDAPRVAPVRLTSSVLGEPAKLQLGAMRAGLGGIEVAGQAGYDATGDRPRVTANLNSKQIDLAQLQALAPPPSSAAAEPADESDSASSEEKTKSAQKSADLEADITVAIERFIVDQATLHDVSAKAVFAEKVLTVSPMSFSVGEGDARGDVGGRVTVHLAGPIPKVDADISASKLDFAMFAPPSQAPEQKPDRLFSPEPFQFDALKAIDGQVTFKGTDLAYGTVTIPELNFDLALNAGHLTVKPLTAVMSNSRMAGRVDLNTAGVPKLNATLTSDSLDVARILMENDVTSAVRGKARTDIAISGQGESMAALMAGLQGHARLLMDEGRIKTQALDLAVGGVRKILGTMFTKGTEWAVLNCVAADFDIDQGIATSRALVADTEFSTVVGEGDINLGTERINLLFTPKSKNVTLNIAVPVKVSGSLVAPHVALDETKLAERVGGAVVTSLIFPPAVLANFVDLGGP